MKNLHHEGFARTDKPDSVNELIEKLEAASQVAFADDICLHLRQEDCRRAAVMIRNLGLFIAHATVTESGLTK